MNVYARRIAFAVIFFSAGWIANALYRDLILSTPSKSYPTNTLAPLDQRRQLTQGYLEQEPSFQQSPRQLPNAKETAPAAAQEPNLTKKSAEQAANPSLDDIWMSNDVSAWSSASKKLLEKVRTLIEQGKTKSARELLDNLLRLDEKNIDALKLSAQVYRNQGQSLLALNEIYKAKFAAIGSDREQSLNQETHQWLSELAAQLMAQNNEIALLDLYKKAVELEPDYGRHYINLAQRYLALGNTSDAVTTLQTARFDSSINIEIDNMLAAIENQKPVDFSSAYKIPLSKNGHQYYVRVRINGEYDSTWLLDTGASVSAITPEAFNGFPIDSGDEGQAWFNTANGMVKGKTVVIHGLTIADIHVDHLRVGVLDLASGGRFDGLLGMDFLRQFNFYLDQKENVLYLKTQ